MRFIATICASLLFAFVMLMTPAAVSAQISISVAIAPPELPEYDQPVCPGDDYIWTPGYWYYGDDDYFWVPGTWVLAPEVGFLWTPPYWGWEGGAYFFHAGYWGPHVGFYGGISYGFGYFGHGFEGGRWDHDHFFYNRSVTNVNVNIRNVYENRVTETRVTRVSFNGGNGGVNERPRADEEAASRERHVPAVAAQEQHRQEAHSNPEQRASVNHGRPAVAATPKPGEFKGGGVVTAREAGKSNNGASRGESGAARSNNPGHVKDLPPAERHAATNTGNTKADQRYQQQQERLNTKQDQERQRVQQKQEQDHQRMEQQKANDTKKQQTEQRHQQQTQQLVQKHTQQQQKLQQRQQPSHQSQSKPTKEKP